MHGGELELDEVGLSWFWAEILWLSSATKRGRRVLTGSSPGGKDLT